MKVNLGEFSFDPIEPTDFRLAVEGASGTGKTNTIACILEDLSGENIPTLIIERLGVLASLRQIDPNLILISNNEEADLTVPIEELDIVGELILDKGLKIMVDIQSYENPTSDDYEAHAATAKALSGLYGRAQERFKQGKRRKCLLVADEVHILAPERSSDQVDRSNSAVKRSLGIFTKLATEGGNLGINQIVAYQRRAMTIKTIVTQFTDKIIHRLHSVDRKSVANEIGVDKDRIRDLECGEAFIYGDFTDHRVIGPTKIRRRETPDPREENFELVEPPEDIKKVLAEVRDKVEEKSRKRKEQVSKIQKLENKVDALKSENEKLKEKAHIKEGLTDLLKSSSSKTPNKVQKRLEELEKESEKLEEKEGAIEEVKEENSKLKEELEEKDKRIEELEADLAEYQDSYQRLQSIKDHLSKMAETLNIGFDSSEINQELEDENEKLREKIERLQKELDTSQEGKNFEGQIEFLQDNKTQGYIKRISKNPPRNVSGKSIRKILLSIANSQEPLTREGIEKTADYSESITRATLNYLEEKELIATYNEGKKTSYDIPLKNMDKITKLMERTKRVEELEEQFT